MFTRNIYNRNILLTCVVTNNQEVGTTYFLGRYLVYLILMYSMYTRKTEMYKRTLWLWYNLPLTAF